jgi:hypothetical protein
MLILERLDAVCRGWDFVPCDDHVAARRGASPELEAAPGLKNGSKDR